MHCTTRDCPHPAERVIAFPVAPGMFVGTYCSEHASDIEVDALGLPAFGPALSAEAREIEEVR